MALAETFQSGDIVEVGGHVHEPPVVCPHFNPSKYSKRADELLEQSGGGELVVAQDVKGKVEGVGEIKIIKETDDVLVINKPAGVPVHPTGRYIKNSLTEVIETEGGYKVYGEFFFLFL